MSMATIFTPKRDSRCKTKNSGVTLAALTSSLASSKDQNPIVGDVIYYGDVLDIIEIDYWSNFHLVLFRSEWYQVMNDNYGLICVNKNKLCYVNDPFVRPSQVHQVFYVGDLEVDGIYFVLNKVPRDIFDFNMDKNIDDGNSFWCEMDNRNINCLPQPSNEELHYTRKDIPPTVLDGNTILTDVNKSGEHNADDSDCDDTL
ncbi:unnamed protein product [Amaranthus hypochondriacus]